MPARHRIAAATPPLRAVLISGVLVAAACSGGPDRAAPTTTTTPDVACRARSGEKMSKALLRCTKRSVVEISTDTTGGTGVVTEIDGRRYVVTNLHVVDPFATVDVSVPGTTLTDVEVVGVDAAADLALLGPLSGDDLGPPLPIADGDDLERGDDVYLVGFPGETDDEDQLESTISSGIVSRIRRLDDYDQTYIQTDASIAGGQSGGPLFDDRGRLVGISGLSFAEEFALALSGRDVLGATTAIADDGGDDYLALPARGGAGGAEEGTFELPDAATFHSLFIPAAEDERRLAFTVDPALRPIVSIQGYQDEQPVAVSLEATDIQQELMQRLAARNGGDPGGLTDDGALGEDPEIRAAQVSPGSFEVTLAPDQPYYIDVSAPLIEAPGSIRWTSSLPAFALTPPPRHATMEVGDTVDEVINGYEMGVEVTVHLEEGGKVELHARSPQSDVAFAILEPGVVVDPLLAFDSEAEGYELVDDTEDGLYGLDARKVFEVPSTGDYRFRLFHNDGTTVALRFSVLDCDAKGVRCSS